MSLLVLDEATHAYSLGGVRVPSVTQIIQAAGFLPPYRGERALDRGSAVHEATRFLDEGDLDEASVDPAVAGYLAAYRAFLRDNAERMDVLFVETPVHSPALGFAGTPDRVVLWDDARAVLDIKSGAPARWHGLQTSGYQMLVPEATVRLGLYLRPDGTYKLHTHEDRTDAPSFLAALSCWRFRERERLLPGWWYE